MYWHEVEPKRHRRARSGRHGKACPSQRSHERIQLYLAKRLAAAFRPGTSQAGGLGRSAVAFGAGGVV